jgi:hypothetical protein
LRRFVTAVILATLFAGCGLVDSDITNFDLFIRDKAFTVDTEQWELQGVDQLTSTDCSQAMTVCAAAAEQACTEGQCFGQCAPEGTCELRVLVALWEGVDTNMENPELMQVADQPVVDVTIDSIAYQVVENNLNIATPEMTVYAAPSTIMAPGNPEARAIGVIPPVESRTLVPETDIVISDEGRDALADFMGDYMTPFNIIVGTEVVIGDGDPVPTGKVSAVVRVRAHAGL